PDPRIPCAITAVFCWSISATPLTHPLSGSRPGGLVRAVRALAKEAAAAVRMRGARAGRVGLAARNAPKEVLRAPSHAIAAAAGMARARLAERRAGRRCRRAAARARAAAARAAAARARAARTGRAADAG